MTNSFSFSRFGSYSASEFRSSLRPMLLKLIIAFGVAMVASFLIGIDNFINDTDEWHRLNSLKISGSITFLACIVYCLRIISNSFRLYHNPLTAPQVMLLPVSKSEKFTFIFLRNVILFPVILFGIWSLTAYIFYGIYGSPEIPELSELLEQKITQLKGGSSILFWERTVQTLSVVSLASLYFFSSVAFRRHQSLFAIVVLVVLGLLTFSTVNIYRFFAETDDIIIFSDYKTEMIWTSIILALISVSLFYFSWRKFKKLQIR